MNLLEQVQKEKQDIVRRATLAWREQRAEFTKYNTKIKV